MNCVQKFVWTAVSVAFCLICAMAEAPADEQKHDSSSSDENKFTAITAQDYKIALPDSSVEIAGPLELTVNWAGVASRVNLHDLYSICQRDDEGCGQALVAQIKQFEASQLKSNLRIVVRGGERVEAIQKQYGEEANALVEPVSGDLWAITIEDFPSFVRYPKPAQIRALGLSPDDGLKLAIANTKTALKNRVPNLTPKDKGSLNVFVGDDFVTTFAFPDLWAPVARTFDGTLIVAVPSTDQMFIIGDDTPDALKLMHKAVDDEWAHAERPLSQSLYRWSENGWVGIAAPANQPVSQAAPKPDTTSQATTAK